MCLKIYSDLKCFPCVVIKNLISCNLKICLNINMIFLLCISIKYILYCNYTFDDRFNIKRKYVRYLINRKRVITIQIWFGSTRFRIDFTVNMRVTYSNDFLGYYCCVMCYYLLQEKYSVSCR